MAKILIVDDDTKIVELLVELLDGSGYDIRKAYNGKEAILLYREDPPDLLIIDMVMPLKGGVEVIKELRVEYPDAKIIAMSGDLSAIELEVLKSKSNLGVICSFEKPFDLMEVLSTVNTILS